MKAYAYLVPWLASYFAAHAAPLEGVSLFERSSSLVKREPKAAGIGVELEVRAFKLSNDRPEAKNADDKMVAAIKGATLIPLPGKGHGNTCGKNWHLTAEHSGSEEDTAISKLTFEWIINGVTLKMKPSKDPKKDLVLPDVAKEIKARTKALDPKKGSEFYIYTKDYKIDQWGSWTLTAPEKYSEGSTAPGVQVTTGLPMEAIQEYLSIMTPNPHDPNEPGEKLDGTPVSLAAFVFGPPKFKTDLVVLITKEDMKDIYDADDITTDLLGFYSLLMSYVNIAANADDQTREKGPKHAIGIMPRTDFKTLYAMYGKDDSSHNKKRCRKKKDPKYEKLIEIVKHLAQKKKLKDSAKIGDKTFKWMRPKVKQQVSGAPTPPIPRGRMRSACETLVERPESVDWKATWPTKDSDYRNGELSVKTWLVFEEGKIDPLAVMERLLWDGQIGGLGDTVEKPLYPEATGENAYGLFEIRDLSRGSFERLENFMESIETQVKTWHHSPPQYPDLKKNSKRAVGASCKKPDNDPKCKGNQIENKGKCEDCPKDQKPDTLHKKCIPDKPGKCTGPQVPNKQNNNKCEACPKGTKPNIGNTLCVPDGPDKDEKGQCKDEGFILDPRVGGQDKNTKDPKCVYDDTRNCEKKGWVAVTRDFKNVVSPQDSKKYTPECAEDKDPNYRCKDSSKTFVHKAMDKNGDQKVLKKTCRSTRDRIKQMKDKYQERVEKAKEQRKKTVDSKQQEKKENNRRERIGMCVTLGLGVNMFKNLDAVAKRDGNGDFDALTPDELDGMLGMWPDGNELDPDIIQDHMVTIGPKPKNAAVVGIDMEAAGRPFPIYWLAKGIQKLIKIFKKPGRSAPPPKTKEFFTNFRNAGSREKPVEKAVKAAQSSAKVKEIFKKIDKCLKTTRKGAKRADDAITQIDVDDMRIVIDFNAKRNNFNVPDTKYEDRVITVKLGQDTENIEGDGGAKDWASTYPDRINRPGRLEYEACQAIPDNLKNKVTAVETWGGCCGFYRNNECRENSFMFAMQDREDWQLDGKDNDNLEAVWCTFEPNCGGVPGAK